MSGCSLWLLPPLLLPTLRIPLSAPIIEQPVTAIPIQGPLSKPRAELSGLAWYGDYLVLLPQFPDRFDNHLFLLHKQDIVDWLTGKLVDPLTPTPIPIDLGGLSWQVTGYEGFEAIAFAGNRVYLTIEASPSSGMTGYLVTGEVAPDLSGIQINRQLITAIEPQSDLWNLSDESIILLDGVVGTIYEANGLLINPNPVVHLFEPTTLTQIGAAPFTNIEYRITDASELDDAGRFWVINYFFPGDRSLRAEILRRRLSINLNIQDVDPIERLVELEYTPEGFQRTATPPIHLQLLDDKTPRNWEGIARLETAEQNGFLLVTDKYPGTILAFVPQPK